MTRDALDSDLARAVRHAALMRRAFYILVLLVALIGQVTGAVQTLDIPVLVAVPAVAALELGGVVVMANADVRRRLGERAIASRILSAAIAAAAVTFNWIVHPDHLAGGFYAGMSALGYLVWLMHAGNQRRDRLRATGDLPPAPPAYEILGHWIRHPVITRRARSIAKADGLDLYQSLIAARATIHREHRDAAIAKVLHRKIRTAVDPTTADIAVQVYDLDKIANRLAATADYDRLTALLAADLTPDRITTSIAPRPRRRWPRRNAGPAPARRTPPEAETSHLPPAADQPGIHTGQPQPEPVPPAANYAAEPTPSPDHPPQQQAVPPPGARSTPDTPESPESNRDAAEDPPDPGAEIPKGTAEAVAYWLSKDPDMDPESLARKVGKSLRSVYRHLPQDYPRRPGTARTRTGRQAKPTPRAGRSS